MNIELFIATLAGFINFNMRIDIINILLKRVISEISGIIFQKRKNFLNFRFFQILLMKFVAWFSARNSKTYSYVVVEILAMVIKCSS